MKSRPALLGLLALLGLCFFAAFLLVLPARADTIGVSTTEDELNADGDCSLREAIQAANTDAPVDACPAGNGADTVILPAGTYLLTVAGAPEDANAAGDFDLTNDVTIRGGGAATTIIDGGALDRLFHIVGSAVNVTLSDLTIQNGLTPVLDPLPNGGGIFNSGVLTLTNASIVGNAASAAGGGVANVGTLTVQNSTFSGNTASGDGGGLSNGMGTLALANSTVSGNIANGDGGGLYNLSTAHLSSATFTDNVADADGDDVGDGGGVFNSAGQTVNFRNTLLGVNFDDSPAAQDDPDCSGTLQSQDYNLIETVSAGCTIAGTTTNNITGGAPALGVLQDNGGPTFTHALLPGSPAIDVGNPTGCTDHLGATLTTDQRGFFRAVDGGIGSERCDIGAYEYLAEIPTPTPTSTDTSTPTSTDTSTPTSTDTSTPTSTDTSTPTSTDTSTPTSTSTSTPTPTPSRTPTRTQTPSQTSTRTSTPTFTPSRTPTSTLTPTITRTPTPSNTPTITPTPSQTPTATPFGAITVNTTVDELNSDGDCSLREAVRAANTNAAVDVCPAGLTGPDTIIVPSGIYTLTMSGTDDAALSGDLDLTGPVTIAGAGAATTIISGGPAFASRLFEVFSTATLRGVTLRNGTASGDGGGLSNTANGKVLLDYSAVVGNQAGGSGGGLYNSGVMTLTNSAVISNTTGEAGGGIRNLGPVGTVTLVNVTLSGNAAGTNGGGLRTSTGTVLLRNVTIANNIADSDADEVGDGGGVFFGSGIVLFVNTVIAGNTDNSPTVRHPDCSDILTSLGRNLIQNVTGCVIGGIAASTLTGLNPQFGPLQNNGGSTLTHALLNGSPAIDMGQNPDCPPTDQRGVARPVGFICDLGAYESPFVRFTTQLWLPIIARGP